MAKPVLDGFPVCVVGYEERCLGVAKLMELQPLVMTLWPLVATGVGDTVGINRKAPCVASLDNFIALIVNPHPEIVLYAKALEPA